MSTTKVTTYSAPTGGSIALTERQIVALRAAGRWPKNSLGDDYCQPSGVRIGHPSRTDAEIAAYANSGEWPDLSEAFPSGMPVRLKGSQLGVSGILRGRVVGINRLDRRVKVKYLWASSEDITPEWVYDEFAIFGVFPDVERRDVEPVNSW